MPNPANLPLPSSARFIVAFLRACLFLALTTWPVRGADPDEPSPVLPPTIQYDGPTDVTQVIASDTLQFGVRVTGDQPITLQWLQDGQPIVDWRYRGSSGWHLFFPRFHPTHVGQYQLEASNAGGTTRGPVITVRSAPTPPPLVDPPAGTYPDRVRIHAAPAIPTSSDVHEIFYTTDGSEPNRTSTHWPGSLTLAFDATLRFRGYVFGLPIDPVVTADYVVEPAPLPRPSASGSTFLAHWRFEYPESRAWAEETGWHPIPRPTVGATPITTGVLGSAVHLDRSQGPGLTPVELPPPDAGAFSVGAWVRVDPVNPQAGGTVWTWGANQLTLDPSGRVVVADAGGSNSATVPARAGTDDVFDGGWHQIVVTCTTHGSDDLRVYVDGKLRGRTLVGARARSAAPIRLGPDFLGDLDEVQVIDAALDGDSVTALRANPLETMPGTWLPKPQPPSIAASSPTLHEFRNAGEAIRLFVTTAGPGPFSYQWFRDGVAIPGATQDSFTTSGTTGPIPGVYSLTVQNSAGTLKSTDFIIRPATLAILSGPADRSLDEGQSWDEVVDVDGLQPIRYQWFKDGNALADATSNTLRLAAVRLPQGGAYQLVASNASGSVTSRVARITVRIFPPVLGTLPASVSVELGSPLHLVASATGAPPLSFRWFRNGLELPGQTSNELKLPSTSLADTGVYSLQVANAHGRVDSNPIQVTIQGSIELDPLVALYPQGGWLPTSPGVVTLIPLAGGVTLRYTLDGSIPTATSPEYANQITLRADATVRAAAFAGDIRRGGVASGTFRLPRPGAPIVTRQPESQSIPLGGTVRLLIHHTEAPNVAYRWFRNGSPIPGAIYSIHDIASFSATNAGTYKVELSNAAATLFSDEATLSIRDARLPFINPLPTITNSFNGLPVRIAPRVFGESPFVYSWYRDSLLIPDQTGPELYFPAPTSADIATYQLQIRNLHGSVRSSLIKLGISSIPGGSKLQAGSITGTAEPIQGSTLSLAVSVTGGQGTLTYAWFRNDALLRSTSGPELLVPAISAAESGSYRVRVGDGFTTVDSPPFLVRVIPPGRDPFIGTIVGPSKVAAGGSLRLSAPWSTSGEPVVFSWYKDGILLPGQNKSQLDIEPVSSADAGTYTLRGTNNLGSTESPPFTLQVLTVQVSVDLFPKGGVYVTSPIQIRFTPDVEATEMRFTLDGSIPTADSTLYTGPIQIRNSTLLVAAAFSGRTRLGPASSENYIIQRGTGPTITSDLFDQSAVPGGSVSLQVTATGSGPFSYWWYKLPSGVPLTRTDSPVLKLSPYSPTDAGTYFVMVSNEVGVAYSRRAQVTTASQPDPNLEPPVISLQVEGAELQNGAAPFPFSFRTGTPFQRPIYAGLGVELTVSVTGSQPMTYIWSRRHLLYNSWTTVGQNSTTLRLTDLKKSDSGQYRVDVRNSAGFVFREIINLDVRDPLPPVISVHPRNTEARLGGQASFYVYLSERIRTTYQWFRDGLPLPSATNASLVRGTVTPRDVGSYHVRVSNPVAGVDSRPAFLRIVDPPVVRVLRATPSPQRGEPLDFEVTATGEGDLRYYWMHDGSPLSLSIFSTTLHLDAAENGRYSVLVSGLGGDTELELAKVEGRVFLETSAENGRLTSTPQQTWHAEGSKVQIQATADPGFAFLWWLGDWDGSTNPAAVVMDRDRKISALFSPVGGTVILANRLAGTDFDAPIFDTDGTTPLSGPTFVARIHAGPVNGPLLPAGAPLAFRAGPGAGYLPGGAVLIPTVAAGQPAQIQLRAWDARNGSTYEEAVNNTGSHGESEPFVLVTGNAGDPPSLPPYLTGLKSFRLRAGAIQPPKLVRAPEPISGLPGATARLEVIADGTQPLAYQWSRDGSPLAGATNGVLDLGALEPAQAGRYGVQVSNRGGILEVPAVAVRILEPTAIAAITSIPAPPVAGSPLRLVVQASGTPPLVARWERDGLPLPSASPLVYETNSALPGTYTVSVSGPAGAASRTAVVVQRRFALGIEADEGGIVRFSPSDTGYDLGTVVAVEASAGPGYEFTGWEGDLAGPVNPLVLTVTGPLSARARFRPVAGTLLFANRLPSASLDSPITLAEDGTRLAGDSWLAQLHVGTDLRSLQPVGDPVPFGAGTNAGYFGPFTRAIASHPPGSTVIAEVRVWENSAGLSFAEAASTEGLIGASGPFKIRISDVGAPPPPLAGLAPFTVAKGRAPALLQPPAPRTVWTGTPLDLLVEVAGHPAPTFHWSLDGAELPGADSNPLRIASPDSTAAGTYSVRIANALGETIVSIPLAVVPPLRILGVTGTRDLLAGDATELRAEVAGTDPIRFRWFRGAPGDESHPLAETSPAWKSGPLFESTHVWVLAEDPGGSRRSEAIDLLVLKRPQRLSFVSPGDLTFSDAPVLLSGTSDAGLPVTWTVLDGPARIGADGRLESTSAGTVLLQLTQPGDARYEAASPLVVPLPVRPGPVRFTFGSLEQRADGNPRTVEVRTEPPGLPVVLTYSGSPSPPTEAGEYLVTAAVNTRDRAGTASATFWVLNRAWEIHGGAFDDQDGNGFWTSNEFGIEGMPIRLTGNGRSVLVFTDAEGRFVFHDVTEGVYTLEQLTPEGAANTTVPQQVLTMGGSGVVPLVEFGSQSANSVGGVAFVDTDGDGQRDPGEPGLAGVTIRLRRDGNELVRVSLPDGQFQFNGIEPGTLTAEASEIPGFEPSSLSTRPVSLSPASSVSVNFGLRPRRSILGVVFDDLNGNGAPDGAEPRLGGLTVILRAAAPSTPVRTTVTGAQGEFAFLDLPGGSYFIEQTLAADRVGTLITTSPALAGAPGPANPPVPEIVRRLVNLPTDGAASVNLGNYLAQRVSGVSFVDRDGDGRQSPGELGLAGVRVRVQDAATGSVLGSSVTDPTGFYAVPGLPAGRYRVIQDQAAGHATPNVIVNLTLAARSAAAVNFANRSLGVAAGRLFLDDDRNQRPGESEAGVGGVTIVLTQPGRPPRTTSTSGDGRFLFTGLEAGEGTISFSAPPGFRATTESSVRFLARPGSGFFATGLFGVASAAPAATSPYDLWAEAAGLPFASRDPAADPDRDGQPNLLEFAMGSSPVRANTDGYPQLSVVRSLGRPVVAFLLPRNRAAAAGLTIRLETSADLVHWSAIDPVATIVTAGAESDLVRLLDPVGPPATGPRFLRLLIRLR